MVPFEFCAARAARSFLLLEVGAVESWKADCQSSSSESEVGDQRERGPSWRRSDLSRTISSSSSVLSSSVTSTKVRRTTVLLTASDLIRQLHPPLIWSKPRLDIFCEARGIRSAVGSAIGALLHQESFDDVFSDPLPLVTPHHTLIVNQAPAIQRIVRIEANPQIRCELLDEFSQPKPVFLAE